MSGFTLADLAELDRAIASGELMIERDGHKVTYRSLDELIKARNIVRGELIEAGYLQSQGSRSVAVTFGRE